ncbi:MAG: Zn-dependent hydrolase [Alphaproteobacteria bacterium]|nr:Zn-dependent hydrolase [Alphaproteobacteria bacterium]
MASSRLAPNGARFWSSIEASAKIGPGQAGGLRRLALTPEDKAMRDVFGEWCRDAGYGLTVDRLGNMFARREGKRPDLPPVLIGSHLDTQVAGGRFDGIVGVLGGLEVLRSLDDAGIETERAVEVVNWTNEEGARFQPPMTCSAVFAGRRPLDWALARSDDNGITVAEALRDIGYDGDTPVGGRVLDSYFELHIEQGPELEDTETQIGLVTGAYFAHGMRISISGGNGHSGPTAMRDRRNALVGASMVAVAVNEVGWRYADRDGKSTVARIEAWPNRPGIISNEATVYVDFRAPTAPLADRMAAEIRDSLADCARRSQCDIDIDEAWQFDQGAFDPDLVRSLARLADELGSSHREIASQAGHDAYNLGHVCPTALIFTPCIGGITHDEREDTRLEDQLPGLTLLLNAVLERASR